MSAGTFGISHIAMKVADLNRSVAFYTAAFGVREYYRDSNSVQVLGPGTTDVMAFELDVSGAGSKGGLLHFGLRLKNPDQFESVVSSAVAAGGRIKDRGDFGENQPYAFIIDPDGYEIEIWHENTPHHAQN